MRRRAFLHAVPVIAASMAVPGAYSWARSRSAHPLTDGDRAAIRAVIARQIQAFRDDDAAAAYRLATPRIQAHFGDADAFMAMVAQHYRAVFRPSAVSFGALTQQNGEVLQHVDLVGPDGRTAEASYRMERQRDGAWRIGGCALTSTGRIAT